MARTQPITISIILTVICYDLMASCTGYRVGLVLQLSPVDASCVCVECFYVFTYLAHVHSDLCFETSDSGLSGFAGFYSWQQLLIEPL